tara:strand:+ start:751 stop:1956 length:1206 start_codon:yes stop_codon:yes gene_type:complete
MRFEESVWDDSDPLYAPCLKKIRTSYYWVTPKKYLTAGYMTKTMRLEGRVGDGLDMERARHCRSLTRELLEWYESETHGKEPGTWAWLIARYLTDEHSDLMEPRPNTRRQYKQVTHMIESAIGDVLLCETDFLRMKSWQRQMAENQRSVSYIQRWFRHLSMILSYGIKIGDHATHNDCIRLKTIRGEMRIKSGPRREVFIKRDEVEAIIDAADKRGWGNLSLAVSIRFELMLRGVDVYGQWVPAEGAKGGIQHNNQIWVDGMTWAGVSPDCTTIVHQISKTRDSMPEPYTFDLTHLPDIRARLESIPKDNRTGPLVVDDRGLPTKHGLLSNRFKKLVRELGLDERLRIGDSRAGGITEAKAMVDPKTLQHAAQHQNQSTTDRYARDRSGSANQVIKLRANR